eukprot:TRINITY_DN1578_c0_g1_i1.p1 TRINITY_DN1578_c0_g1~~TRINITY_DN1578_c0_g1_i1.p1  ORF type:complete len:417 (+),score=97.55 TRINITY_DN1578_c0_g1_i1:23-1252(+)
MSTSEVPTDLNWLIPYLKLSQEDAQAVQLRLEPFEAAGGLTAAMMFLSVDVPGKTGYPKRYIYKTTPKHRWEVIQPLGTPREAFFYNEFAQQLFSSSDNFSLPRVLYAKGVMETGEKILVMEDLSSGGVQSGYFFGPGSPLNWGHDLKQKLSKVPNVDQLTAVDIARATFIEIAKLHKFFWKKEDILKNSFLRGSQWVLGNGRESWEAAQNQAKSMWSAAKKKIESGESKVNWDNNLVQCLDAALVNVNWDDYAQSTQKLPWTLVHGDLHPANCIWLFSEDGKNVENSFGGRPVLVDWEMVGLGSGPQDIAQYLISHMNPKLRKENELSLLKSYYQELTSHTDNEHLKAYTFDECLDEYRRFGAGRWLWFVAYLSSICPDNVVQYFQDQTAAFLTDHNLNQQNIGMPRV